MYITTADGLQRAVDERLKHQETIRARLNEWVEKAYGITDFTELCCRRVPFFADSGSGKPRAVVARQVASLSTEDVACFLGSERLGLQAVTLTYGRDCFVTGSFDKVARVRIPWIEWSKKGNMVLAYDTVVPHKMGVYDMRILSTIETIAGAPLLDYHAELRRRVFSGTYPCGDVSGFHAECLSKATSQPEFVYKNVHNYDRRTPRVEFSDTDPLLCRPPSAWYYPLYFSWFLDGSMVLLETYENPSGGVPQAKVLFEETVRIIEDAVGWQPLVVEIPHLSPDMLYHNKALLEKPCAITELLAAPVENGTLPGFFRKLADAVIAYR